MTTFIGATKTSDLNIPAPHGTKNAGETYDPTGERPTAKPPVNRPQITVTKPSRTTVTEFSPPPPPTTTHKCIPGKGTVCHDNPSTSVYEDDDPQLNSGPIPLYNDDLTYLSNQKDGSLGTKEKSSPTVYTKDAQTEIPSDEQLLKIQGGGNQANPFIGQESSNRPAEDTTIYTENTQTEITTGETRANAEAVTDEEVEDFLNLDTQSDKSADLPSTSESNSRILWIAGGTIGLLALAALVYWMKNKED